MTAMTSPLQNASADWCLRFLERRCGDFVSAAFTDEGKPDEVGDTSGAFVLSLAEIDLVTDAQGAAEHEHLAVLALRLRAQPGAPTDRLVLRFIPSSTMRSASRAFGSRWLINDLTVSTPPGLDEVALLIYRVGPTLRLKRVVKAIEKLFEGLEDGRDDEDLVLGRAALERFEVLDAEAAVVVGGCRLRFSDGTRAGYGPRADRYLAVVGASGGVPNVDHLWLTDRKLQEGLDRASAKPISGKPFVILRLGAKSNRQSGLDFIQDIRRRREAAPADQGESYATFVDRELNKRRKERIEAKYGHHKIVPKVTPMHIEATGNLEGTVDLVKTPPSRFQQLIDAMGASVDRTFGTHVPELSIRFDKSNSSVGTYSLMLEEVPLESGRFDPQNLLCLADSSELLKASIEGEWKVGLDDATLPGSDRAACWIPVERGETVRAVGFETLDAAEYIEAHLRSVIVTHLDMFATLDHIATQLSDKSRERIRGERGGLPRFVEVVRSLLMEGITITPIEPLAQRYIALANGLTAEVAEELRLLPTVLARLKREMASWHLFVLFVLSHEYEAQIRACVHSEGDAAILALEPKLAQEMLTAIRDRVDVKVNGKVQVLVVEDWRLRPFVRSLVVIEFPRLRVVARREVEDVVEMPAPTAAISVKPQR